MFFEFVYRGCITRNLRSTAIVLTPKGHNAYVSWGQWYETILNLSDPTSFFPFMILVLNPLFPRCQVLCKAMSFTSFRNPSCSFRLAIIVS